MYCKRKVEIVRKYYISHLDEINFTIDETGLETQKITDMKASLGITNPTPAKC